MITKFKTARALPNTALGPQVCAQEPPWPGIASLCGEEGKVHTLLRRAVQDLPREGKGTSR